MSIGDRVSSNLNVHRYRTKRRITRKWLVLREVGTVTAVQGVKVTVQPENSGPPITRHKKYWSAFPA